MCDKCFTIKSYLTSHKKRMHRLVKDFKCQGCDKEFAYSYHVKQHVRFVHPEKETERLQCDSCDKSYYKSNHLKRHIETAHEGKRLKCDMCGREFTNKRNLKNYTQSVHENKTFDCKDCSMKQGMKYPSQMKLKKHIRSEHSDNIGFEIRKKKIAKCEQCDTVLSSKGHMKRHMNSLHSETSIESLRLKCPHCNKEYTSVYLQNHMKRKHATS